MAAPLAGSEKKGLDSGSVGNVGLLIQATGEMGFWSLLGAQAGAPVVELGKQAWGVSAHCRCHHCRVML